MGLYPFGARCCNNCWNWDSSYDRKIRGNPPKEIYSESNCDKCILTQKNTLSKDSCPAFRHLYGATDTHPLDVKEPNTVAGKLIQDIDESGRSLLNSVFDYMETRQNIACASSILENKKEEEEDELLFSDELRKSMAEQKKANDRAVELIKEGLSTKYMFREQSVEFMHLLDKANHGDGKSQFALAQAFWNGSNGAEKDHIKGWRWCDRAAENGYSYAQLWKGVTHRNDAVKNGNIDDHICAVKWLEKALDHSEIREKDREENRSYSKALNSSRITLGIKYVNGQDVSPDLDKAMFYLNAAVDTWDSEAIEIKKKVEELCAKLKTHVDVWKDAADNGSGEALNIMGMIYAGYQKYKQYGLIVKTDPNAAFECFQKAADDECPDGMDNLGNCYKNGVGTEKDVAKAVEWYKKSADCGWGSGRYHYATCLRKGEGVEKDEQEALRWYMKAGAAGDAKSLNALGWCAEGGRGMNEDPELAFEWYRLAAEAGDAESMHELGRCYKKGYGCDADESLGEEWQKKAKENGYKVNSGW